MLKFLGKGSAFNTELLNNSAFVKNNNKLLLIDCGGMIFDRLKELKLLEGIESIDVIITHIHPDHVGSLGDLIFYAHYILEKKVRVFHPSKQLPRLLKLLGVKEEIYELNSSFTFKIEGLYQNSTEIEFVEVSHTDSMDSYGFILSNGEQSLYYSGDSNQIPVNILNEFLVRNIENIYHDTCGVDYKGNGHMYIGKLESAIPKHLREFVHCMHLDKFMNEDELIEKGFKTLAIYE
ncbi:MAG: MBL fold metallo-hydrolase [Sarcina sp.]